MPVTCVARAFYAEFDDVKGPVVLYEEPPGCLTRDEEGRRIWECFGDYVITGREPLDGVAVRARAGRDAREFRARETRHGGVARARSSETAGATRVGGDGDARAG